MPTKTSFFKYIALIYAILIFIVSGIPTLSPPSVGLVLEDKILHFIEYMIFSLLLFLAFSVSKKEFLKRNVFLLSTVVGTVYAASDEIHQIFVPGRSCEFFDFVADCLGIIVVQVAIWLYLRRSTKKPVAQKQALP
jgi:VanZ family protein